MHTMTVVPQRSASLLILLTLMAASVYGQCSDAGVCSVGAAHSMDRRTEYGLAYGYGSSDKGSFTYHDLGLRATIPFGDDLDLGVGLPVRSTSGPAGSASGFGDLILTIGRPLVSGDAVTIRGDIGVRIATGSVNTSDLPQAYQPGLGTNDLIFGLNISGSWWNAGAGYQWSPGRSSNSVDRLRRGDDMLVRVGVRPDGLPGRLSAEVLGIQRLNSSVVHRAIATSGPSPEYVDTVVPDTDRLQINILLRAEVVVSESLSLHPQFAMALLERPVNVDGLTRSARFQVEIVYMMP